MTNLWFDGCSILIATNKRECEPWGFHGGEVSSRGLPGCRRWTCQRPLKHWCPITKLLVVTTSEDLDLKVSTKYFEVWTIMKVWDSPVGITGWTIGWSEFDSRRGLGIFLFTTASRLALAPTQPPIQRLTGALSLGVKRPGRETDHSHIVPRSKNTSSYSSIPPYTFMLWCTVKKAQGQLYLYLCLKFVRHNLKVSHHCHVCNTDMKTMFHVEFLGMFVTLPCAISCD
jgi:hypothetical protein